MTSILQKRSPAKAERTWVKTHDNAVTEYGERGRAARQGRGESFGGVDEGRYGMSKKELARAIAGRQ